MKSACSRQGPAVTRRQLLATAGAGAGAIALGGLGFTGAPLVAQTIQIGDTGTPAAPSVPTAAPSTGETVAEVAARLGFDAAAITAFVRDEIAYEAYDGILRGANGTLWARAGNSADQALLLGALLEAAQIPHRFASGPLDTAGEDLLIAGLSRTREAALATADAANTAALRHHLGVDELPATPPALDPETMRVVTEYDASVRQAVDVALASADTSTSAITGALATGGISLPTLPAASLPEWERAQHAWVQIADGPGWIDIDPSLPADATIGPATETVETPPDDWYHWLRFVIVADEWIGGAPMRREVVSLSAASPRLVDVPVALSMASADELAGVGTGINQVLTGQKTIYPSIYADNLTVDAPTPIIFGTDAANASDPFGGTGGVLGEGETIAVWLQVEITSPSAGMIVIERPLLDRVPAEDRASGTVTPERIAPLKTVPTEIGDDTIEQFNVVTVIHTSVARVPATDAFVRYGQDEVFGALGLLGPALADLRDTLGAVLETRAGVWSYPSAPNITVFHAGAPGDDGVVTLWSDLLYRQRVTVPLADGPTSPVDPFVLSGVLDAVAEQMLLSPELRGETGSATNVAAGPSVAAIFAEAVASGTALRLVSTPADLSAIALDPLSRSLLETALANGEVAVVPETPVVIAGVPVLGWWLVDPQTGRTRDQLQNGMGGAASTSQTGRHIRFGNSWGYTFLNRAIMWVAARGRAFACLGAGIAYGFFVTVAVLGGIGDFPAPFGGALIGLGLAGAGTTGGVAAAVC